MNDANGVELLNAPLVVLSSENATAESLQLRDDVGELEIAFLFEMAENARTKEDLRQTDAIEILVKFEFFDLANQRKRVVEIEFTCGSRLPFSARPLCHP